MKKALLILMILPFLLIGQKRVKKDNEDTRQLINSKYLLRENSSEKKFIIRKKYAKNGCNRSSISKITSRFNVKYKSKLDRRFRKISSKYDVNNDEFISEEKIKVANVYNTSKVESYFSGTIQNLYYNEVSFTGIIFDTFQSGVVRNQVQYYNGVIDGISLSWYENGKINFRKRFINGKADIPSKSWYVDGKKKSEIIKINDSIFSDSTIISYNINNSSNSEFNTYYDSLSYSLLLNKSNDKRKEIHELKTRYNSNLDNNIALIFEYDNLFNDLADQDVTICNYINSLDVDKLLKILDRYKEKGKLGKKKMNIYLDYFDEKIKIEEIEKLILLKLDDIKFNNNLMFLSKETLSNLESESQVILSEMRNERAKDIYKHDHQYTYWHENGVIFKRGVFVNQLKNGLYEEWYEEGHEKLQGYYAKGLKDQLWREWYENSQMSFQGKYTQGLKDGLCKKWYENGKIKSQYFYTAGVKDSLCEDWYENGKRASTIGYNIKGEKHGDLKYWHENGRKKISGNYITNNRDGIWRWWYENGRLKTKCSYNKGNRVNTNEDKYYNEDGSVTKPPPAKVEPRSKARNYISNLGMKLDGRMMLFSGNWPHYIWYAHAWSGSGYNSTLVTFYLITHDAGKNFEINIE